MKYLKFWIVASMGLAGAFFLFWMMTASSEAAAPSAGNTCAKITEQADRLAWRLNGSNIFEPNTLAYRDLWLTLGNLIVDSPYCFDAQLVAETKSKMQQYLSH